jgi:hypothetical protein
MAEPPTMQPRQRTESGQIQEVLDHLEGIVIEGLKHGFFDCSITCEIASGGKRDLVIRGGKTHKFTIPAAQVPR